MPQRKPAGLVCGNCGRPVKWVDSPVTGRILVHADADESLVFCYPNEGCHLNYKHAELRP